MTASEKILAFVRNSFDTALYFAVMAVKENFRNYVGRVGTVGVPKSSALILGNGPSLAEDLPRSISRGRSSASEGPLPRIRTEGFGSPTVPARQM